MYKNRKIRIKSFQENHSFSFIEDPETILELTNEVLDSPFSSVYCQSYFTPCKTGSPYLEKFTDYQYRSAKVLEEKHMPLMEKPITYAEELALLGRYLARKNEELEKGEYIDKLLKLHTELYLGYL